MEHTHTDGCLVDWSTIHGLGAPPVVPDAFHLSASEPNNFSYQWSKYSPGVGNIASPDDDAFAWWSALDAWLNSSALLTEYHRESLWVMMSPFVRRIAYSQDAFQKGMLAIWDELGNWHEKYPIDHSPRSQADDDRGDVLVDVVKYLSGVARNAMCGRKRKATLFDDELVKNAEVPQTDELTDEEIDQIIREMPISEIEKAILLCKRERLSEAEIGQKVGLSRSQVKRRIGRLYKELCAKHKLAPKPMGRAKRKKQLS